MNNRLLIIKKEKNISGIKSIPNANLYVKVC